MSPAVTAKEKLEEVGSVEDLGRGARFVLYVSSAVKEARPRAVFTAHLKQGDWDGTVSSDHPILQTDGMSGVFELNVDYTEPPAEFIAPVDGPSEIGCNESCVSMIEIGLEGEKLIYETTWDAVCTG